jgi:hypothetical protein
LLASEAGERKGLYARGRIEVIENSYGQIELETESLGASEVMTIAGARS